MPPPPPPGPGAEELESQTVALRLIAALLAVGAAWLLSSVLVPLFLALALAIALSPLADKLERLGMNRTVSSLVALALVAVVLLMAAGLLATQAGAILQEADEYLAQFGRKLAWLSSKVGGDRVLRSLGDLGSEEGGDSAAYWDKAVRRSARVLGGWVVSGLGGVLGALGGVVITLAYLFYMLVTRSDWIARLRLAGLRLGMRPNPERLGRIRDETSTYIRRLAMISAAYAVVISLALWALGVPQPLLWGVLTAILELIPYFGPLIAGALPTIVSLGTDGPSWQPLAVVGLFVVLQTIEGYVVAPMFYGKAVAIDPVTVLLGVLFFGFLWGPVGLALAMPMMILLRGLLTMTPDTPALDALADVDPAAAARPGSGGAVRAGAAS